MNLSNSKLGKATVVEINGRIDSSTTNTFEAHCSKLVANGSSWLVLDLESVVYLNSGALRSILTLQKKVKPLGGNLVICGAKGPVREIFDISGFSNMFPMAATMEEAAKFVM